MPCRLVHTTEHPHSERIEAHLNVRGYWDLHFQEFTDALQFPIGELRDDIIDDWLNSSPIHVEIFEQITYKENEDVEYYDTGKRLENSRRLYGWGERRTGRFGRNWF